MSKWYYIVTADLSKIPDCIDFFENEYEDARVELKFAGKTIERHGAELPGLVEYRFTQLQEIDAILEFLNIKLRKMRAEKFKKYLESYNRQLSSRDAEKYIDGEVDVVDMTMLVNEFALIRNKFLGITKGLDTKNWMVGHITKLRVAGLDDAQID
jgi:hypothetical protein